MAWGGSEADMNYRVGLVAQGVAPDAVGMGWVTHLHDVPTDESE